METTAHITTSLSPGHRKQETAPTASQGDSHAVSKRLQSELMSLMASADPGVSAFPDGDSLFSWMGSIQGVQGTVYESLSYKLSLKFPSGMSAALRINNGLRLTFFFTLCWQRTVFYQMMMSASLGSAKRDYDTPHSLSGCGRWN